MSARKDYAKRIKAALGKSVVGFIEAGRELTKAKAELEHGQFEDMVEEDLAMNPSTARRLMSIAAHPVLSNRAHVHDLPPTWGTLYELTKVPIPRLEAKLKDGTINPQMERKDVTALIPGKRTRRRRPKQQRRELADEPIPGDTPLERWQYSVGFIAGEAISLEAFWTRTFKEEWKEFEVSSDLVTLAQQAADAWVKIANDLTLRAGAIPIRRKDHGN